MKQENILNSVTIDAGKTYTFSANAVYNLGNETISPFTVALTDGSGAAVIDSANTIAGSQLTGDWNGVQSVQLSGADLLAAGQVNVIFDLVNSTDIPGFPGGDPDPLDLSLVAQVRVFSVLLGETFIQQPGDMNKDGVVNQADVDLANSYLDGSIDGPLGDDAATAQANLVTGGMTGPEALAALNLTQFDIDENGTFDAADVTALQALLSPPLTVLSAVRNGSSFDVEVSGLTIGANYSLLKDTDLGALPSFDEIADSITAASATETLTDTNAVDEQAFYIIQGD
jgi:hypothetical protein